MPRLPCRLKTLLFSALLLLAGCHQQASPPAPRGPAQAARSSPQVGLAGELLRIQDGDSFIARLQDGSRLTVRLSGIDAPERSQPHADQSRQNLQRLLQGRSLQIHVAKKDQYGRAVAQVFAETDGAELDVGLAQMERGLAWFYHQYRGDLPREWRETYAKAEQAARRARLGLWQAADAQPPWEFRASRRADAGPTGL